MALVIDRSYEQRQPPGPGPGWCERFEFEFHSPRATFGGHVVVWLWPTAGRAWYWAGVVEEGRPLVSIVETEVPLPRRALELRSSGLWADHIAETPLEHWSVGLEAFAVRVDEPTDVLGAFRGERVPLGFDLEWEVDGATEVLVPPGTAEGSYAQPCAVHGDVLLGADTYDLQGSGRRSHRWGGLRPDGGGDGDGDGGGDGDGAGEWPADGLPTIGDAEVVGWSPARLVAPDGVRFDEARALCRSPGGQVGWRHFARVR
jgi:hypothetical protein